MTTADLLYLALIAILLLLDYFVLWPTFVRRSQADPGRERTWLWSSWMIELWTLVAAGVALWLFEARTWGSLRLVSPHGWRLWGSIGLVLMLVITNARSAVRIARSTRRSAMLNILKLAQQELARAESASQANQEEFENQRGWRSLASRHSTRFANGDWFACR